jgi:hypothetical protein
MTLTCFVVTLPPQKQQSEDSCLGVINRDCLRLSFGFGVMGGFVLSMADKRLDSRDVHGDSWRRTFLRL